MINILYEDKSLIVVEKPAGVDSQENKGFGKDMVSEIRKHLKKSGSKDMYVGVIHRLDRPVRGIMVFAKTPKAAAKLSDQMRKQEHMEKKYMAITNGKVDKGTLVDYLSFDKANNISVVSNENDKNAKKAILDYSCLETKTYMEWMECEADGKWKIFDEQRKILAREKKERGSIISLVEVTLHTGRHHQIRVQMSNAGYSIIGDVKYNSIFEDYRGKSAICLCSVMVSFIHPDTGEKMQFSII